MVKFKVEAETRRRVKIKVQTAIEMAALDFGEWVKEEIRSSVISDNHDATGFLADSIEVIPYWDDEAVDIELATRFRWLERGRHPGREPTAAALSNIKEWLAAIGKPATDYNASMVYNAINDRYQAGEWYLDDILGVDGHDRFMKYFRLRL